MQGPSLNQVTGVGDPTALLSTLLMCGTVHPSRKASCRQALPTLACSPSLQGGAGPGSQGQVGFVSAAAAVSQVCVLLDSLLRRQLLCGRGANTSPPGDILETEGY